MLLLIEAGCKNKPKVIEPSDGNSGGTAGIFDQKQPPVIPDEHEHVHSADIHTVVVEEVLPTVKYVYIRVKEGQDEFWIATIKRQVDVGRTYHYQGGLLKTNFQSREHKRVFDRMYLVSSIIEADHANSSSTSAVISQDNATSSKSTAGPSESIKIADLVANPEKFEGNSVLVSGECVKINSNIMGKNWVHIRDGSKGDFELVVTTDIQVPVGHKVTMRGSVVLNADFGSGYHYAILLEDGELVR